MSDQDSSPAITPVRRLPEAFLLAIATAAAYLLAFYFEKGYFEQFRIPQDLVEVQLTTILLFAAITITAFAFIFPFVNLTALVVSTFASKPLSRALAPLFFVLIPTILQLYLFGLSDTTRWLPLLALFLIIAFLQLVFPLITQRKTVGYTQKLIAQEEVEAQVRTIPDYVRARYGKDLLLLVAAVFIGTSIAWNMGAAEAVNKTSFLALDSDPSLVAVRVYPDRGLFVRLAEDSITVLPEYAIIPIPPSGLELITRDTGRLRLPRPPSTPTPTPTSVPATAVEPTNPDPTPVP